MKIILIRHGETDGNIFESGSKELNRHGTLQAKKLAKILKNYKIDLLYSSDSERALKTAKIINKKLKVKEIVSAEFHEIYQVLIGGSVKPGVDPNREARDKSRADKAFKNLTKLEGQTIGIVTHGNLIRYFIGKALNIKTKKLCHLRIYNCSLTILEFKNNKIYLEAINIPVEKINHFL